MAKQSLFELALVKEGVTGKLADVARSIYQQESGSGRNTKASNAGAVGGMQILPGTFAGVADKDWDISNPEHNARAGIRYLKQMDKKAGGDPLLIAAGYYGGVGGMEKARKGIAVSDPRNPNAPTTLQYAQQVVSRMPGDGPVASEAPVVASAGSYVPADPAPVVEPVAAAPVVEDPWAGFQHAMPSQVQVADINYGPAVPAVRIDPLAYMGSADVPDFRAFTRWKGKV